VLSVLLLFLSWLPFFAEARLNNDKEGFSSKMTERKGKNNAIWLGRGSVLRFKKGKTGGHVGYNKKDGFHAGVTHRISDHPNVRITGYVSKRKASLGIKAGH